jgi:glycerophosphoryl diester phosphodiesterase
MYIQKRRPIIFAHRGASAHAPENTLAAFELAIQQQADLVEVDTKLSADKRVVVIHDQTIDRTTDGSGRVSDLTFNNLRTFNAGYRFRDTYPDETIPALEEVIEICTGRIQINIELSNYFTPLDGLAEEVSRIINQYQLHEEVIVSGFHPIPLRRFHNLSPEVAIAFLARPGLQGFLSRSWLGRVLVPYDALHPEKRDVTPGLIATGRKFGFPIHTFTVNDRAEMAELVSLGVDGLITDDPLLARSVIDPDQSFESESRLESS